MVVMSKRELADLLEDLAEKVRYDDSFTGSIRYSAMDPQLEPGTYQVDGKYQLDENNEIEL